MGAPNAQTMPPPDVGGEGEVVASIQVLSLTANRLVASDGTKTLVSVSTLTSWVAGTSNQLTVADDGDGTITLALATNLYSDGAGKASFRNGTEAQEVRVYKTFTSSTNYERFIAIWESDVCFLRTEKGSGGGTDRAMTIGPNGTANLNFQAGGFVRWGVSQSSGTLFPNGDNAYDIGATGGFLPRDVYAGRQFIGPGGSKSAVSYAVATTNTGWFQRVGSNFNLSIDGVEVWNISSMLVNFGGASIGLAAGTSETNVADVIISRVSAGIGKVTNGVSACEWRVHGDATKYTRVAHNGTYGAISTSATGGNLYLGVQDSLVWFIEASTGHFSSNSNNTNDIGIVGSLPRSIRWGTQALGPSSGTAYSFAADTDTAFGRLGENVVGFTLGGIPLHEFAGTYYANYSDLARIALGASADVNLYRDAANALAERNGTAAQEFRVYGTFTDASNYERLSLHFNGTFNIYSQSAGTGTNRSLSIGTTGSGLLIAVTDNTTRWFVNASGHTLANTDNAIDLGGSGNAFRTGYFGTAVVIGSTPATTGGIRIQNGVSIDWRRADDGANINGIYLDGSNIVQLYNGLLGLTTTALTFSDSYNMAFNTSTGTKIGTGNTQKIGFWDKAPVVQPAAIADLGAFTGGVIGFLDAAERDGIRTKINDILAKLRLPGLIAT